MAFDLDCMFAKLRGALSGEHPLGPVYVCGMARSGTTILLQLLADLPEFASLTYRAMPFVMCPRIGKFLGGQNRKAIPARERFHGDGVLISLDTAEAFEEVFWLTMNAAVASEKTYDFSAPDGDVLQRFANYRQLVAGSEKRYLSKNNNNVGRMSELMRNPKAQIVFAIRDPLATATSMHRVHQKLQSADAFVAEYMGWLGHHEFGPAHLPFGFAAPQQDKSLSPDTLDYWLDYWIAVHDAILPVMQNAEQNHLLVHDDLQKDPAAVLAALAGRLNVMPQGLRDWATTIRTSKRNENSDAVAKTRLGRARELYNAFISSPMKVR